VISRERSKDRIAVGAASGTNYRPDDCADQQDAAGGVNRFAIACFSLL
jgi:hypothetical protein